MKKILSALMVFVPSFAVLAAPEAEVSQVSPSPEPPPTEVLPKKRAPKVKAPPKIETPAAEEATSETDSDAPAVTEEGGEENETPVVNVAPPTPPKVRRVSLAVAPGLSIIPYKVNGFEMYPALSGGARVTFDIFSFWAIGLESHLDLIHFDDDDDKNRRDSLDITKLTHLMVMEFKHPAGIAVGPLFGLSQTTYNYRKNGGLSHRDPKGTDNIWTWGITAGWMFTPGNNAFQLGPRLDYLRYQSSSKHYLRPHTSLHGTFVLKFLF